MHAEKGHGIVSSMSYAGATYLYENFVGPGFHKVKAEARKVPALQKLMDGNAPKTI